MTDSGSDDVPEAVPLRAAGGQKGGTQAPVPVTLISGFLGAGKTTLVKRILTEKHGYRIAVIMNEFGDSGSVESAFMCDEQGKDLMDKQDWVELANGCLCCSAKDNMVQALEGLMSRRDRFDYVLLEATGLANPGPIASALWTDEQLEAGVMLDSVVTVVDALHVSREITAQRPDDAINEVALQIAYADIVLLNKMDQVGEEAVDKARADIKAVNSTVRIIPTVRCDVDIGLILGQNRYSQQRGAMDVIEEEASVTGDDGSSPKPPEDSASSSSHDSSTGHDRCEPGCEHPSHHHRHHHHHHSHSYHQSFSTPLAKGSLAGSDNRIHDSRINTVTLSTPRPLDIDLLKAFVDRLLWEREAVAAVDIYRIKGVLSIAGSDAMHSLQGVYEAYEIKQGPLWGDGKAEASHSGAAAAEGSGQQQQRQQQRQPSAPRVSRLTLIGRLPDRASLQQQLEQCEAK